MANGVIRQIMKLNHIFPLFILLVVVTKSTDAETISCTKGEHSRKIKFDDDTKEENFKLSKDCLENEKDYKLSLLLYKKEAFNCRKTHYLNVVATHANGSTTKIDNWGPCPSDKNTFDDSFSGYHYGDKYMRSNFTLSDAVEYKVTRKGSWDDKHVYLVATAYYEVANDSECESDFFNCNKIRDCKDLPSGSPIRRCIANELKCNDIPNCGLQCNEDESNDVCHTFRYMIDLQYIATTFLAALFFILSPTVVVFLLFYRRKIRLQELRRLELEGRIREARESKMVGTISTKANDHPPSYDVVHETMEPPPCFCEAVAISTIQETGTANGDEKPKGETVCTCKTSTVFTARPIP